VFGGEVDGTRMLRQCGRTYDWWPCEVLSKEHILLLLCARHLVYSILTLVVLPAMSTRADATRLSRVYCSRDATGRPLHANALMQLAYRSCLGSARAWVADREQGNETLLQIYA
jgi:hypothetical protein